MDRSVGANLSAADGEQPVEERVFPFGGLETGQRTEVGSARRRVVAGIARDCVSRDPGAIADHRLDTVGVGRVQRIRKAE